MSLSALFNIEVSHFPFTSHQHIHLSHFPFTSHQHIHMSHLPFTSHQHILLLTRSHTCLSYTSSIHSIHYLYSYDTAINNTQCKGNHRHITYIPLIFISLHIQLFKEQRNVWNVWTLKQIRKGITFQLTGFQLR